jgi:hypothetical protein
VAHVVGAGDLAHWPPVAVAASDRLALLMIGQFRFAAELAPLALARSRPSPVRVRIKSLSNSARPPNTVSIKRPCAVMVSAHVSPSEQKPAFLTVIAASV